MSNSNNNKEKIEFEMLDYERLENETISFKLEDGTIIKIKVDLNRVGKAINFTNPDGTPHYVIDTAFKTSIIPPNRRFFVNKSSFKGKQPLSSSPRPPDQMFS